MIRLHCFGFTFTPRLLPTLFVLIGLPILFSLGVWQLNRATEKRQLLTQFQSQTDTILQLKDIQQQPLENLAYRKIQISGYYDNRHQILIDNKISRHHVGYEVLTPFIPSYGKQVLLVNRGWIIGTGRRDRLPAIAPSTGRQTIEGFIKLIPKSVFVLGREAAITAWPARIQALNLSRIAKAYQKPLYPFIVLLSPKSPGGFTREWKPVVVSPEKHLGYAIQWFALSLTLVMMYLCFSIKRGHYDKSGTT